MQTPLENLFEVTLSHNGYDYLLGKSGYWLIIRCADVATFVTESEAHEAIAKSDSSDNATTRANARVVPCP